MWKNWCFWTVVLEKTLESPWTARRSNQSILKKISAEYSLEELMLKLKFQYLTTWCKEPTHWKSPWCWERLKVGREGDNRGWMASPTRWTWVWVGSGDGQGCLVCCSPWGQKESDTTEWLNWTDKKHNSKQWKSIHYNYMQKYMPHMCKNTHKHNTEWKKPDLEEYMQYDSIYIKF